MEKKYLLNIQLFGKKESTEINYGEPTDAEDIEVDSDYVEDEDTDEEEEDGTSDEVEDQDEEQEKDEENEEEETKEESTKEESQKEKSKEESTKEETSKEVNETKKVQNRDVNHDMAEKRRLAEEAKKKEREIYLKGFKNAVGGKNPFTGEPIESDEDVTTCELMLEAKQKGLDPITDFYKIQKEHIKAEKEKQEKAVKDEEERQQRVRKDIEDFSNEFPEVSVNDLMHDSEFKEFAEDLIGNVSLSTVYKKYQKMISSKANAVKREKMMTESRKESTPGSLTGGGSGNGELYTIEQLRSMSSSEIKRNWAKVSKSYNALQK